MLILNSTCVKIFLYLLYIILICLGLSNTTSNFIVGCIIPILIIISFLKSKEKMKYLIKLSLNLSIINIYWCIFWFIVGLCLEPSFFPILMCNINCVNDNFDYSNEIKSHGLDRVKLNSQGFPIIWYPPGEPGWGSNLPKWEEAIWKYNEFSSTDKQIIEFLDKTRDIEFLKKFRAQLEQHNSKHVPTGNNFAYEKAYSLNPKIDPDIIPYKDLYDKNNLSQIEVKKHVIEQMARLKMEMAYYTILSKAKLYHEKNLLATDNLILKFFNSLKLNLWDDSNYKCFQIWKIRHLNFVLFFDSYKGFAIDYTQDVNVYKTINHDLIETYYHILELKALLDKLIELKIDINNVDKYYYIDILQQVFSDHKKSMLKWMNI